jgi:hypothetical protein
MRANGKARDRGSVFMVISCREKMAFTDKVFDYVRGNGTREIGMVVFSP